MAIINVIRDACQRLLLNKERRMHASQWSNYNRLNTNGLTLCWITARGKCIILLDFSPPVNSLPLFDFLAFAATEAVCVCPTGGGGSLGLAHGRPGPRCSVSLGGCTWEQHNTHVMNESSVVAWLPDVTRPVPREPAWGPDCPTSLLASLSRNPWLRYILEKQARQTCTSHLTYPARRAPIMSWYK